MRPLPLIIGVLIAIGIAFFFLNTEPAPSVEHVDDATVEDRCAEFRQTIDDEEGDEVYSLGYKGRIRQLLNGCF